MQRDARRIGPGGAASFQNLRCEMKSRGRGRRRAWFFRIDRLVALAIACRILAPDIRGSGTWPRRSMAASISTSPSIRIVRSPRSPVPVTIAPSVSSNVMTAPSCRRRPGRTRARHSRRSADNDSSRRTSTAPVPPARVPYSREGRTRVSFSTRQSPCRRNSGRSRKVRSSQLCVARSTTSIRESSRRARGVWAIRCGGRSK
jgi:hypothetical protein